MTLEELVRFPVMLTREECVALYQLIDELSGFNAGNVFSWDGQDNLGDPTTAACVKIFKAIGRSIPPGLSE